MKVAASGETPKISATKSLIAPINYSNLFYLLKNNSTGPFVIKNPINIINKLNKNFKPIFFDFIFTLKSSGMILNTTKYEFINPHTIHTGIKTWLSKGSPAVLAAKK